jgi:hypothetical protein
VGCGGCGGGVCGGAGGGGCGGGCALLADCGRANTVCGPLCRRGTSSCRGGAPRWRRCRSAGWPCAPRWRVAALERFVRERGHRHRYHRHCHCHHSHHSHHHHHRHRCHRQHRHHCHHCHHCHHYCHIIAAATAPTNCSTHARSPGPAWLASWLKGSPASAQLPRVMYVPCRALAAERVTVHTRRWRRRAAPPWRAEASPQARTRARVSRMTSRPWKRTVAAAPLPQSALCVD